MACIIDSCLSGDGTEPAGAKHVGGREQARDEIVGREIRGGYEGAVSKRDAQQLSLGA